MTRASCAHAVRWISLWWKLAAALSTGGKTTTTFGLDLYLEDEQKITTMFSSQARRGFTYRWTKCTSLCRWDLQRFLFWPRTAAALFGRNNEQSGARRRDVVKISAHQTIWLPLLSILSHFHSSSSSFVFFVLCWGRNVLPGAAWQMKMRKREKRKTGEDETRRRGENEKWFWSALLH